MRAAPLYVLSAVLFFVCLPLHGKSKQLTVTGKLTEISTTVGEAAWAIQLNPVIMVGGRQLSSLEIKTSHPQKLESLQDTFVQAKGTLVSAAATDAPDVPVLELSSIHALKYNNPDRDKPKFSLWSSVANFFCLSPI